MRRRDFITRRRLAWAAVFIFGCYGLVLLWGGVATARNAVEQFHCDEVLRTIFARMESERTKREGDRFTGDDIVRMVDDMAREQGSQHSGPCRDLRRAYVVAKNVELPLRAGTVTRVIICDATGNHILYLANGFRSRLNGVLQEGASLLRSDGSILHWHGDSPVYSNWVARVANGEDPGELPEPDSTNDIVWLP